MVYDVILIVAIVVAVIAAALFFLNRWAAKKMGEQQDMIERTKQTVSIYVIDKKKTLAKDANLPKAVMDKLPKTSRVMKMYMVKAKIGPQIMTLISDKRVFEAIPVKKSVKVDLAGMYIVGLKGMKSQKEMKEIKKNRQKSAKESAGTREIKGNRQKDVKESTVSKETRKKKEAK